MSVSLIINNTPYSGWKTIEITRSIEAIAGQFHFSVSDPWGSDADIQSGDRCTVKIDDDVVITGFVDNVEPGFDARSHIIEISGRDATADLWDCSAINSPGQWNNQPIEKIIRDLCAPFEIDVTVAAGVDTGAAFKKFAINQGDTVHECIMRLCKMRALLAVPDREGGLILTRAGTNPASVAIVEGENLKAARGGNSWRDRYSDYYVKGQTQGGANSTGNVTTQCRGKAVDSKITRHRPLLVVAESQADTKACQERANWEAGTRQGKGRRSSLTVQGWRQGANAHSALWEINSLTPVRSTRARLRETMLIVSTTFTLSDNGGSITVMEVTPPEAFKLIAQREESL